MLTGSSVSHSIYKHRA